MGDWGTIQRLEEIETDEVVSVVLDVAGTLKDLFIAGMTGAETKPAVRLTATTQHPIRQGVLTGIYRSGRDMAR